MRNIVNSPYRSRIFNKKIEIRMLNLIEFQKHILSFEVLLLRKPSCDCIGFVSLYVSLYSLF